MSEAANFFEKLKKGIVGGLFTSAIAQIEVYDPRLNKADVTLLPGGDLIKSVPVGIQQTSDFFVRMPYKRGDHVLLVFCQRDIDPIMYGSSEVPSKRMLAIDDAVIVCGINVYSDPLPTADANKLVIGQKNGAAKVAIGGGRVDLTGNVFVNGTKLEAGSGNF